MSLKKIIEESTVMAESHHDITTGQIADILNKHSFAIIRGVVKPAEVVESMQLIRANFDASNDSPATGEDPSDIMSNFQKLSIGGAEHSGVYRPRCMRTFYNPIWAEDKFKLRDVFRRVAQVRNVIYGMDPNYAIDDVEDGFWTAARIHHYPAGGGFLVSHLDDVVPVVQNAEGISHYYQPVIMMSKKGTGEDCDFQTGGGFFQVGEERFYYEAECELGDLVIYSGATIHGVADIDLAKPFDSHSSAGRYAAFVTLYREFKRKGQLEDYVKPGNTVY